MKKRREAQRAMMRAHHKQQQQQQQHALEQENVENIEEDISIEEEVEVIEEEEEIQDVIQEVINEDDDEKMEEKVDERVPFIKSMSNMQINTLKKPHKITPRRVKRNATMATLQVLEQKNSPCSTSQSIRSKSPHSKRSKSPHSRRSKSPHSKRSKSPHSRKTKSPYTQKQQQKPEYKKEESQSTIHQRSHTPSSEISGGSWMDNLDDIQSSISTTTKQPIKATTKVSLYGCGANDSYQLRHQNIHVSSIIQPLNIETPFALQDLEDIGLGDNHTVYLTSKGDVYVIGSNEYGQCGGHKNEPPYHELTKLNLGNTTIAAIAVGPFHTLMLSTFGKLFVCGRNHRGQCGGFFEQDTIFGVSNVPLSFMVASITTGDDYTFMTTPTGEVYMCGDNNFAKGGCSTTINTTTQLTRLNLISDHSSKIKSIAPSSTHTLFLFDDGSVMVCGLNNHAQCGIPNEPMVKKPTLMKQKYLKNQRVSRIQTTKMNSFFWTDPQTCFVSGPLKPLGILPTITRKTQFSKPRQLKLKYLFQNASSKNLSSISCSSQGSEFLYYHLSDNSTYVMGANKYGQLALGEQKMEIGHPECIRTFEKMKDAPYIQHVYCSKRHAILVVTSST